MRRVTVAGWGIGVAGLAGAALVAIPLLALALYPGQGGAVAESPWAVFADPALAGLLLRSVRLALLTAAGALIIGVPVGIRLGVQAGLLTRALAWIQFLPLCLPPYLIALGCAALTGRNGLLTGVIGLRGAERLSAFLYAESGVLVVLVISLAPLVTLTTALFVRMIDSTRVEAALLVRTAPASLARVVLPHAIPGVLLGGLLVFALAFAEVAVPQLLRVKVYATTVFTRLADLSFAPGMALARSVPPMLLVLFVAMLLYWLDAAGRQSMGLRCRLPKAIVSGVPGGIVHGALGIAAAAAILPLGAIAIQAFTERGGGAAAVWSARSALWSSISHSALTALFLTLLAIPAAWGWSRRPRLGAVGSLPLLLGFLTPSAVLGTGIVLCWNHPATQLVYDSAWIIVIGLAAKYGYLPFRALKLGFDRTPRSWIEAARLHDRSPLRRFVRVALLGNLDAVLGVFGLSFMLCLRDLDTIVLFYPPGAETLPVRTMTIEANAPPGLTATTALLQIVLTVALLIGMGLATRRWRTP